MVSWVIDSPQFAGGQTVTDVSTVRRHELGSIAQAHDADGASGGGEFIYLKGAASVATGTWVTYNLDDGSVTRLVATAIGPVAIAMAALVASTFGWYQIAGKAIGACLTLFADNANVYATATDGSVDDASVAGDAVLNAKGASLTAVSSGVAEFEISRPFISSRVAPVG